MRGQERRKYIRKTKVNIICEEISKRGTRE